MSGIDDDRPTEAPAFLSTAQAGTYLNLSPRTLEKLRVVGGGPIFLKFGKRVVYALDDLQNWASARRRASTSDSGRSGMMAS